jgi:hypothetical protein
MPATIKNALADPLVTVVRKDKKRSIFKIKIGELGTVVTIKMYFDEDNRLWRLEQSHAIHTPKQAGPYRSSVRSDSDRAWLLLKAVGALTSYYRKAKKVGHKPRETWLVPWDLEPRKAPALSAPPKRQKANKRSSGR